MTGESKIMREILSATYTRIAVSVLLGFAIGSVFMAVFNENVVATYETLFSNPGLTLQTAGQTILDGYGLGHLLHFGRELNSMDQVIGIMLVIVLIGLLADKLVAALKAVERVAQPAVLAAKVAPLVRRLPKPAVLRPCAVASRPRQGRPHQGPMV